jgi:hypothetical protein
VARNKTVTEVATLQGVTRSFDVHISPEASSDDREAIAVAVRQTLEREAGLARPAAWRLSGWVAQRVGITDLGRWVPASRLWPLSAHVPWGGRTFPGLIGRGEAK